MAKLNDIKGKTFGSWLVLYRNGSTPNKASVWHCKCLLCGNEYDVVGASLTNGISRMCRHCVPKQTLSLPFRKSRLYHIYTSMKQRCTNENNKSFHRYGGRGITVCNEWLLNPDAFIAWALDSGYNDTLTIDRIDNDKSYSPDNCRWVSAAVQNRNRRSNVMIRFQGNNMTLTEACQSSGIKYDAVRSYKHRHDTDYQTAFDHYILPDCTA